MAPDDERAEKVLVYDGDCRFCVGAVGTFVRPWLTGPTKARPFADFEGSMAERLRAAGIHNEMAVHDPATDEIRTGFDGILWALREGRAPWLATLLGWGPIGWLLRHDYRLFASNRRIFRPPPRGATCACEPDLHRGYRWAFLATTWLWAALFGAAFAVLLLPDHAAPAVRRAWIGALLGPGGWWLLAPAALWMRSPRGLDYLGHLGWILAATFVPAMAAVFLALLFSIFGWREEVHRIFVAEGPAEVLRWAALAGGLAVALISCMRRLPRVGLTALAAATCAVVLWTGLGGATVWLLL
jgi:predicted DCC family thiol-disulfide oxidoreductase YuxK